MSVMRFFDWLEHSSFSMWIKESSSLWPYDIFCLSAHAIGMAILVGFSVAIALRVLGFAPRLPVAPMGQFFPVIYAGFWINAISGTGLFITYPMKAMTNPIFFLKIAGVVLALLCVRRMKREVFDNPLSAATTPAPKSGRMAAAALLVVWVVTITAGRLLAYEGIPAIEWRAALGMIIVSGVTLLVGFVLARRRRSGRTSQAGL